MGLERISAVMQGTHDNYQTDLFQSLIRTSSEISGTSPDGEYNVSHRVISDHLRATSFLITDGVLPSNEGRGYVLRRIMRRAMRHAHLMGCEDIFLFKLVPELVHQMGQAFPELARAQDLISETLKLEETRFKNTLDRGLKLLDEETNKLSSGGILPGDIAFKLYDTFGFPLDLTVDALRSQGYRIDHKGFEVAMEKQRSDARASWSGSGDLATEMVWFDIKQEFGATEFLGYDAEIGEGEVVALVLKGVNVMQAEAGSDVLIILNQTPFYGESGGQQGDFGSMNNDSGVKINIYNTQKKLGDLIVHEGKIIGTKLKVGDQLELMVNHERRSSIRTHHSATHLLHSALQNKLGRHVTQKGSLVAEDKLRFDVSHPTAISREDLDKVEDQVNKQIRLNTEVITRLMTPDEAIGMGAMALFGEKYGDEVRVVSMGFSNEKEFFSTELCGGTHTKRTGDIGVFRILSETAVSSGVRRIEAVAGITAQNYIINDSKILLDTANLLKVPIADIPRRTEVLLEDRKKLEKEIVDLRRELASGNNDQLEIKKISNINFIGKHLNDLPAKDLKGLADEFRSQIGSGVVALTSLHENKVSIVVSVTDDLTDEISAVDLVKLGANVVDGKGGGGRVDMAQAGGPNSAKVGEVIESIENELMLKT